MSEKHFACKKIIIHGDLELQGKLIQKKLKIPDCYGDYKYDRVCNMCDIINSEIHDNCKRFKKDKRGKILKDK